MAGLTDQITAESVLRVARRLAFWLGAGLILIYLLIVAVLYTYQRDMLFARIRSPHGLQPPYQARLITERDGTRLGTREIPATRAGQPVMVFFYGNAGTVSDFANIGAAFHDEGFAVVLASYRGYGGNPGSPSEEGVMADARAILATLPKDHGPVVLWGQSLGSGVAARMAAEGRAQLLILQSPYTAVVDVAARRFPIVPVRWLMSDRFDTFSLVPRIKVSVLIMSGDQDGVVPYDMGQRLAKSFGRQATFVTFPGGGHELYADDVQRVASTWLKTTLRAR